MKKIELLPILLGSDENAYGCAREFYDGYKINPLLYCSRPLPPTSYSRILTRRVIKGLDEPEVFKSIMKETLPVLKNAAEKLLIIPCSDYYAELTVKNRVLLSEFSDTPIISKQLYERVSGKSAFYKLCKEKGLPCPETEFHTAESLLSICQTIDCPVVIKPDNSNSFSYLHLNMENRKKVYICQSCEEIKTIAEGLFSSGYTAPLTVQRYIPGDKALTVNAYCDKVGRVRLIGAARPLLEYRSPTLIGNYAALKTVKAEDVCDRIASFLEDIGYVGFVNFDLKFDEKTGEYLFFELNPRQGRSSYYMQAAEAGLMTALCEDVIFNKEYSGIKYAKEGVVWRNISKMLLKKHVPSEPSKSLCAISYLYDPSPARAINLLKRDIGSIGLLKE